MPWILDGVTQIEYEALYTIFGFNCANWPDGELDEEGWEALLEMAEDWQQTIGQEEAAPTPIRRPTATPKPQLQTSETHHDSTVIEAGWSADVFIWPEAAPGYLNFEFSSTHDIRTHEALNVGFQIQTASDKLVFRTRPITAYRGAIHSQKGEYYYWRFSNRHSQFASKYVKVSVFWSSQPVRGYPVIPYYGAEAGSEACRQMEEYLARHRARQAQKEEAVVSGIFRAAVNYFNPAGLGMIGTIGALMPAISSIFSNDEAGMDTAAAATIAWGCGIE